MERTNEKITENISALHNQIIDKIINFRKTAWGIDDEEAQRLQRENYLNKQGEPLNGR